jgi:uncharacterized membrane protein YcaP (DUF421 family)
MATVLIRTLLVYILFICVIRLTGKRQVGELQISELVITFMVSELATIPIQDISIPLSYSIFPIIFLLAFEVILSFIMTKSVKAKKLFAGNPSILIKKGKLNQGELSNLRIGVNELLGELRLKDVSDISQVDYAILEQNGKLSVFLKENESSAPSITGIGHAIVIDGVINESNLKYSNKNEAWLYKQLTASKIELNDVFLMTVDDDSKINIIRKEIK